ncbi:MAG: helix-turn-helix domain-containing protein [Clostridia bacterium]|nr:helix-turn-helix domain-containing protein [Clostridia bacterium]
MTGNILAYAPQWNKQYTTMSEAPALLTIEEAAILFKIPQDNVRILCRNNTFVAFKIGREWRIHKEETLKKLTGGV